VGEGEESFYELVAGRPLEEVKGLVYKDGKGRIRSNERRITEDIDTIPFPKFRMFELEKYPTRIIPIISSRGCPFKCIFCQQSSLLSKNWRGVSAGYFIRALKYWKDKGHDDIHVLDDNFAFDINRLRGIAELYEKEGLKDVKLSLIGGVRISSGSKEILGLLKRLGVDYISFGIESFSDPVLDFIRKGTTEKKIEEAVRNATEMGFKVRLFFIIGFPYQTKESLRNTYKFVLKYPVYQVRFFNLIPYENTGLMEWLDENGRMIYDPYEYMNNFKRYQDIPVFEAKHTMSPEERKNELKIAREFEKLIAERKKYLFDEI
ncbi:radical SAM protein, partial [Candidatus Woesearchaeota archaeon]|nr:radical SAM protein [Candidatus Woesearchaeota archaeon]